MAYILRGTRTLLDYWKTLGRPCNKRELAYAIKSTMINFESSGRDKVSLTLKYGEKEAQNLATLLGTSVANVTTNGGQEYQP